MSLQSGFAQVRTAGVSEGDWFKYGFTFDWDYELNATAEDFIFTDFLQSDWVILAIQDVTETNVTGQFTIHFENGTEKLLDGSVDLTTGEGDLRNWLISANLNANDSLYVSETDEMINETVNQTYLWDSTETNHLESSFDFIEGNDYSFLCLDFYWDRETGVLTELSFEAEVQQNGTLMNGSASWLLTESNLEYIPEFTQTALILMLVSMPVLISILKIKGNVKL